MPLQRFIKATPILAIISLVGMAWFNRSTPFRGEHWAMLYSYVNAPHWQEGLRHVSQFECFANVRFQPLTFFIPLLPYLFFHHYFVFHYLCSVLLQVCYAGSILLVLEAMRASAVGEKFSISFLSFIKLYTKYPLEAALLMVLFFGADILTWSMYSYLQLATILIYFAIAYYWNAQPYLALLLISIATLIYEPAWAVGILFVVFQLPHWKNHPRPIVVGAILSSGFGGVFYLRYLQHLSGLKNTDSGRESLLLALPTLQKGILLLIKWLYAMAVTTTQFIFPLSAERNSIFELKLIPMIQHLNPVVLFFVVILALLFTGKDRRNQFLWAAVFGLFAIIAWARTDETPYVIHQFRYAYLLAGPIFLIGYRTLAGIRLSFPRFFLAVISAMFFIQLGATLRHGAEVRVAMEPLAKLVSAVPGEAPKDTVNRVVNSLVLGSVSTPPPLVPFIYNAHSCLWQWVEWMK